ncbi:hypothetical protein RHMOL_Rhmol11G0169900 [Rhododendron molle]|uniref:Uncharacterized protein n=1 Tax=Rhododendron molle TaxID=49168 RepID=A0ACC0LT85_RHOML|nr:hypothetical protein RHMOL_Rhmol11G0169900 [Rhododendron molle]
MGCVQERPALAELRSNSPQLVLSPPAFKSPENNSTHHLGVRSSQIPCINLLVDLNNTECRKRRRRELTNLLKIREELDGDPSLVRASQPSSEDISQGSPSIVNEVRATMAVGGELDINFLPDDNETLQRMIELEVEEYSLVKERGVGV